eukprot:2782439-Rhodomonas_salina.3
MPLSWVPGSVGRAGCHAAVGTSEPGPLPWGGHSEAMSLESAGTRSGRIFRASGADSEPLAVSPNIH